MQLKSANGCRRVRAVIAGCCLLGVVAMGAQPAQLVVRGANVLTVDTNKPRAQAFAIADGKFVAVGSDESMRPFIDAKTRVLDLAGKTVVPGFIDAHAHPGPEYPEDSAFAAVDCRPEKVRTI